MRLIFPACLFSVLLLTSALSGCVTNNEADDPLPVFIETPDPWVLANPRHPFMSFSVEFRCEDCDENSSGNITLQGLNWTWYKEVYRYDFFEWFDANLSNVSVYEVDDVWFMKIRYQGGGYSGSEREDGISFFGGVEWSSHLSEEVYEYSIDLDWVPDGQEKNGTLSVLLKGEHHDSYCWSLVGDFAGLDNVSIDPGQQRVILDREFEIGCR